MNISISDWIQITVVITAVGASIVALVIAAKDRRNATAIAEADRRNAIDQALLLAELEAATRLAIIEARGGHTDPAIRKDMGAEGMALTTLLGLSASLICGSAESRRATQSCEPTSKTRPMSSSSGTLSKRSGRSTTSSRICAHCDLKADHQRERNFCPGSSISRGGSTLHPAPRSTSATSDCMSLAIVRA